MFEGFKYWFHEITVIQQIKEVLFFLSKLRIIHMLKISIDHIEITVCTSSGESMRSIAKKNRFLSDRIQINHLMQLSSLKNELQTIS